MLGVIVEQLSLTVGFPNVTLLAVHNPASTFTVTSVGQVMLGGILSVLIVLVRYFANKDD